MSGATPRDLKISRKLKKIIQRTEELVRKETGEDLGIGIVVFPWAKKEEGEVAEFQYISNAPRRFMHSVLKALVKKWDEGYPDMPPHEKQ